VLTDQSLDESLSLTVRLARRRGKFAIAGRFRGFGDLWLGQALD
jgi:hypothetical protein